MHSAETVPEGPSQSVPVPSRGVATSTCVSEAMGVTSKATEVHSPHCSVGSRSCDARQAHPLLCGLRRDPAETGSLSFETHNSDDLRVTFRVLLPLSWTPALPSVEVAVGNLRMTHLFGHTLSVLC